MKVLGIDIASAAWSSVGNAIIEFDADSQRFETVRPAVIDWPTGDLSPNALADAIDAFARANAVSAVALDGPQGWRDPATPAGLPGVGRRCEFECRTQAKTGSYPTTYPGNQRSWIEFSIAVFDRLLSKPDVILADACAIQDRRRGYLVAECYPTSAWRSSSLSPLPGKSKRPELAGYAADLRTAYDLPPITLSMSHDDLQAIVAALVAVAIVGGPALAIPCGTEATTVSGLNGESLRIEGLIWNVTPRSGPRLLPTRPRGIGLPDNEFGGAVAARVTQPVIDQVARAGPSQGQIALRGMPGGTKRVPIPLTFTLNNENFTLLVGETNAAWRSHQDDTTSEGFERLYALLGDAPDIWHTARRAHALTAFYSILGIRTIDEAIPRFGVMDRPPRKPGIALSPDHPRARHHRSTRPGPASSYSGARNERPAGNSSRDRRGSCAARARTRRRRGARLSESLRSVLAGPVAGQPHFVLALKALVTAVGSAQSGAAPSGATRDTTLRSGRAEPGQKSLAGPQISLDEISTARERTSLPLSRARRISTTIRQDARTTIDPARASSGETIASRRGPERAKKPRVKRGNDDEQRRAQGPR